MSIGEPRDLLPYSLAINCAILCAWFAVSVFAHDWLHRLHARRFRLAAERFDAIHCAAMAACKPGILLLNLVPRLALYILHPD